MPCRFRSAAYGLIALLAITAWPAVAVGDDVLVWDNYPAGLQDATFNMSSERNTQIVESTWVVDDVDLSAWPGGFQDLAISRLVWIGARHPDYAYGKADVIFLDSQFHTILTLSDLDYALTDLTPDPNPAPQARTYEGRIDFDPPLAAADLGEHFYVGVRLVGAGFQQGRNCFVASSVDQTLRGRTEGYVLAAIFGAPYWRPASDVWYGAPAPGINFEFAFRLYAASAACPGDLTGDGTVNLSDLSLLLEHYGQSDATPADGDLDGDGDVDLQDLTALVQLYGSQCG